jgi:hypothetical protein
MFIKKTFNKEDKGKKMKIREKDRKTEFEISA